MACRGAAFPSAQYTKKAIIYKQMSQRWSVMQSVRKTSWSK